MGRYSHKEEYRCEKRLPWRRTRWPSRWHNQTWAESPKTTWHKGLLQVGEEQRNSSRASGSVVRSAFKTLTCRTSWVTQTKVDSPSELSIFICPTGTRKQQLWEKRSSNDDCRGLACHGPSAWGLDKHFPSHLYFTHPPPYKWRVASASKEQKHKRWPREKGNASPMFWGRLSLNKMQTIFLTKRQCFRKLSLQVCLETKIHDLQKLLMQIP